MCRKQKETFKLCKEPKTLGGSNMIIDRIAFVWENLETSYKEYLNKGGNLSKTEYLKGIAFIKDEKYVQSLLTAVLGQEVVNYTPQQHEIMQDILNLTATIAYGILKNPDVIVEDLDEFVGKILEQSLEGGNSTSKNYTAQDAGIIRQLDYANLKDAVNKGFICTTSFYDDAGELHTVRVNNTTGALFYVANTNEAEVFCFLKEAGVYPDIPFYNKVYQDLSENSYEGDVVFIDSSLYTIHNDIRRVYDKEIKVHEANGRFLGKFKGAFTTCTFICFE